MSHDYGLNDGKEVMAVRTLCNLDTKELTGIWNATEPNCGYTELD